MAYSHTPIQSPFYLQWERYPYLRGPNYVRPMFREHGPGGNFKSHPIERIMLPASGLGEVTIPQGCWDVPGFKDEHKRCFDVAREFVRLRAGGAPQTDAPGADEYYKCAQTCSTDECLQACSKPIIDSTLKTCPATMSDAQCEKKMVDNCLIGAREAYCKDMPMKPGFFDDLFKDPVKIGIVVLVAALGVSFVVARKKAAPTVPIRYATSPVSVRVRRRRR